MADLIRILIADDHPIVRAGVRLLAESGTDLEVVGETSCGSGVFALLEEEEPDVIVLDLWLGDDDGLEVLRQLRANGSAVPVLIYSMNDEKLYGERSIQAGAQGYLMKDEDLEELTVALRAIVSGKRYISAKLTEILVDASLGSSREEIRTELGMLRDLTARELQVLRLIGRGIATGEIARSLGVSPRTIGAHRENLKNKLGADSAQDLTRMAVTFVEQHAI